MKEEKMSPKIPNPQNKWVRNTFNLQRKDDEVPLIMVKAVGKTAEQKGDDIVDMIPLVTKHYAYLNKNIILMAMKETFFFSNVS